MSAPVTSRRAVDGRTHDADGGVDRDTGDVLCAVECGLAQCSAVDEERCGLDEKETARIRSVQIVALVLQTGVLELEVAGDGSCRGGSKIEKC